MGKITLELELDESVNVGALSAIDTSIITQSVAEIIKKHDDGLLATKALECDNALQKWIDRTGFFGVTAIVRAETYGQRCFDYRCELPSWPFKYRDNPQRPVLMMGAKTACIGRYANSWISPHCANGWARYVYKRFLRRIKYSCFESDEHRNNLYKLQIMERLHKKHYLTYHFDEQISRYDGVDRLDWGTYRVYIGGKHIWLDENQFKYLKTLHDIVKKTHRLDERARALKFWRKEEAAE